MATAAAAQSTEVEPRTALNKERARMVVVDWWPGRRCGGCLWPAVQQGKGECESRKLLDRLVDHHIFLRPHAEDEVLHTWPHPGRPIGCCASLAILPRAKTNHCKRRADIYSLGLVSMTLHHHTIS